MQPALQEVLSAAVRGRLVALVGAGVSAASGIPTFRGRDGIWTVGSSSYMPQEIATHAFFRRAPELVWRWYLYRRGLCLRSEPNPAHLALAELERLLGARFVLVTQNVDGLHQRAGSTRLFEIHGNLHHMRCDAACHDVVWPVPGAPSAAGAAPLAPGELARLRCRRCRGWGRPHVLWFDEFYDEAYYRRNSAVEAVRGAALLLVAGTSGATTLPVVLAEMAAAQGIPIVNVDPQDNPFAALSPGRGVHLRAPAEVALPQVAACVATLCGADAVDGAAAPRHDA